MKKLKIKGIDYIKYDTGVMVPASCVNESQKISNPESVLPLLGSIQCESQEVFMVITLDGSSQTIQAREVTRGLVNQSQIHPREVFRQAIKDNAVSIVIAHNHPSGSLNASAADQETTKRLVKASKIIGIGILDHIIVSPKGHKSIREENPELFI